MVVLVLVPVSEATTLEEEVAAGYSSDLTGLLQPASQREDQPEHGGCLCVELGLTCRRPGSPLHTSTGAYRPQL